MRVLVVLDNHTRECLALDASSRIDGMDVVASLKRITRTHGLPKRIKVELDFSRPVRPSDNALVEEFNSRFRQECLNEHWFLSMEDAREKITRWQIGYNTERPHIDFGPEKGCGPQEKIHTENGTKKGEQNR